MKLLMILLLAATGVGCGYSSHTNTPPTPGTMPTIAQLTPPSTAAGSSDFTLTVQGTNFGSKAVVNFNGTAMATTFDSATEVKAAIPASAVATAGTAKVTVTNPGTPGGLYGGGTAAATSAPMDFPIT
jgi:hypothetical protein